MIYSTRFIQGPGPDELDYVVPAGFVAVVVDVSVGGFAAAAQGADFTINGHVVWAQTIDVGGFGEYMNAQWRGRAVANEGETITGSTSISSLAITITGYLLTQ